MYKLLKVKDVVRIPPRMFTMDPKEAAKIVLRETYEGIYDRDEGVVLAILDVEEISEGVIVPGDGATYHEAIFNVLVWEPRNQEVVEGEVVEMMPYGAFIRIGPMDGLVHISQLMDDYVVFDEKNRQFIGKETNRVLKLGDYVRARIIGVSVKSRVIRENKINMTMRQPGLGKFEWIEKEKKKAKEESKGE
ncbi:DNA-directed RNA polymerase, subunit E' [Thermococcus kodakarensis KOD1]|uniref:DNA-directed RNA polymerase subunit Rpo7 n=1 Tax=Thermococcus kodakarensis (strain ATCC BAA-918 / JCM 12380 / KOD1) TaxID=69014 RepID=Q5JIY4_THEKO|nr:DNA-directed RNA polymerase [Thermococcus kodakarensis]4QIW_E Chain E, DNA-directed RNA polymerase, subunit E' [Thermococcus kodakarensis KOD1]4QIW_Q Chain Q, DNA-directed RNA polymerase, subunit E' [Thermococcus kodakarensis KOD1]4QJF_A Chain A, DNA-directed RNA polymerase, subunit E' [Thermococcus kodakarensis KOD1]6KF3_E Chain E, DNA-directed RNA polymerase, subunit E [Thermococcus kodakarensis KOD1]6KF4_E Chain E, DNA-directed RNA polymerase, subunit E [Thermococcus kodakarensis KOD1]6